MFTPQRSGLKHEGNQSKATETFLNNNWRIPNDSMAIHLLLRTQLLKQANQQAFMSKHQTKLLTKCYTAITFQVIFILQPCDCHYCLNLSVSKTTLIEPQSRFKSAMTKCNVWLITEITQLSIKQIDISINTFMGKSCKSLHGSTVQLSTSIRFSKTPHTITHTRKRSKIRK